MKKKEKFRWLLVDDQENVFTWIIQYHAWYGWITIKTISDEQYNKVEYIKELVNNLNK